MYLAPLHLCEANRIVMSAATESRRTVERRRSSLQMMNSIEADMHQLVEEHVAKQRTGKQARSCP